MKQEKGGTVSAEMGVAYTETKDQEMIHRAGVLSQDTVCVMEMATWSCCCTQNDFPFALKKSAPLTDTNESKEGDTSAPPIMFD